MGIRRIVHPVERAIDDLYSMGRRHPNGRSPAPVPRTVDGTFEPHALPNDYEKPGRHQQKPEDPQDQQAPGYDNDSHGWVRGMGRESPHPHFDRSPPGDKLRR